MAIQDYLNNDFEKFAVEAGATIDNAVENTDESIEKANKKAEIRTRIEEMKRKIANLENQRKMAVEQRDKLRQQRESLTDDQIVQMAKVKGIKDEDLNAFINARNSQRSAKNEEERLQLMKDQVAGQKVANELDELKKNQEKTIADNTLKAQQKKELTDKLDALVADITKLNVEIGMGDDAKKATASASKKLLEKRLEAGKAEYKELTGTDYTEKPEEFVRPEAPVVAEPEAPNEGKPEGWSWTDYGAWKDADAPGKAKIEAKYKDKKAGQDENARKLKEKRDDIYSKGQKATSYDDAMSKAREYCATFKTGAPTRKDLVEAWGWDFNTHQRKDK